MDDTPKREPEASESAPAKTEAAKGGARPVGGPTLSQKLWGTADAGLTTDEIMAMTRARSMRR